MLGGALISPEVARLGGLLWPGVPPLDAAIALLLVGYALAALLNLGIPDSGVRYRRAHRAPPVRVAGAAGQVGVGPVVAGVTGERDEV